MVGVHLSPASSLDVGWATPFRAIGRELGKGCWASTPTPDGATASVRRSAGTGVSRRRGRSARPPRTPPPQPATGGRKGSCDVTCPGASSEACAPIGDGAFRTRLAPLTRRGSGGGQRARLCDAPMGRRAPAPRAAAARGADPQPQARHCRVRPVWTSKSTTGSSRRFSAIDLQPTSPTRVRRGSPRRAVRT